MKRTRRRWPVHSLPPALAPLGAYRQFCTYRLVPSVRKPGKTDKLPCDWRTGQVVGAHNPAIWCSFDEAAAAVAAGRGHGVGFVFTAADPFWFLDIDSALRPDGTWSSLAIDLCNALRRRRGGGSQSGGPAYHRHRRRAASTGAKIFPLTSSSTRKSGSWRSPARTPWATRRTDHSAYMAALVPALFPPGATAGAGPDDWTTSR
jgi:hypothetical protein